VECLHQYPTSAAKRGKAEGGKLLWSEQASSEQKKVSHLKVTVERIKINPSSLF
jgi:hypothetical protein